MSGAISSLPNMPSWCGAQLKAQGHLYLTFNKNGRPCLVEILKCIWKDNIKIGLKEIRYVGETIKKKIMWGQLGELGVL
jgi:hypothetical protein